MKQTPISAICLTPSFAGSRTAPFLKLEPVLAFVLALLIAATFWSQQRYPALLKKLGAGHSIQVKGDLSFDALLPVLPAMPLGERVARTGVNWLWTNRFGMYFALPFGACLMTLLSVTERPGRRRTAAGNILFGAVAGAPMGVCTNCATPIAQSMIAGGASARMTVAAMISSPSFNPVVVAMVFVLFPTPIALLRVATPALLLLALPLLVRETEPQIRSITWPEALPSLGERLIVLCKTLGRNLLRLTVMTLPWMLLAALLGSLAVELIPAYGTHLHASVLGVLLVSCLGTLLPVPMALDVALAFVLYRAGAPPAYVVALLCTLGPVSIYSLSAMGKQLSRQTALKLAGATALVGTLAGLAVFYSK
jgi:uncharacterized membrane protein YraQ (UPF0718 family)